MESHALSRRSPRLVAYLLPLLAALALYLPTLAFQLTFDDDAHVKRPGEIETRTLAEVWNTPYWGSGEAGGLYRPVVSTTYWVGNKAQLPLAARHGINVLAYVLVTLLVVRLALALGVSPLVAGILGLIFAVHTAHVEVVAGMVGRTELMAAGFMLLALLLHDRETAPPAESGILRMPAGGTKAMAWVWGIVLAFLAAGSKESAWALPLFAFTLDIARRRSPWKAWPAQGGYLLGIGGHLFLRHEVLGGWLNSPRFLLTEFDNPLVELWGLERVLGAVRVLGLFLAHLVLPLSLAPDYSGPQIDPSGGWLDPRLWAGVLFLVGSIAVTVWGLRRLRTERPAGGAALFVGGAWLFFSTILFMNLIVPLGTILADRILFWPSVAWVLILGGLGEVVRGAVPALGTGLRPRGRLQWAWGALALVLVVGYTAQAVLYLPAWANDKVLFEHGVKRAPRSARLWYNLAREYRAEKRQDDAVTAFRRARELEPTYSEAWAEEGSLLVEMGRNKEGRTALDEARRLNPNDIALQINEGVALGNAGDNLRAADRFKEVLDRYPKIPEALFNLAGAENLLGRYKDAAGTWLRYLDQRPNDLVAQNNLAWLIATKLDGAAAVESLAIETAAADPQNPHYKDTLAEILFRLGKREQAIHLEREAATLDTAAHYQDQIRRFEHEEPPKPVAP